MKAIFFCVMAKTIPTLSTNWSPRQVFSVSFPFFCTFMNPLPVIQASVIVSSAAGSEASCSY